MLTHPQRFVGFDATVGTLFGRAVGLDCGEAGAFTLALVFEHLRERVDDAVSLLRYLVAPLPALLLEEGD